MTLKTVTIPSEQLQLIKLALAKYSFQTDDQYERFDCLTLSALLNYEVRISVPEANAQSFAALHGVDFPEYIENGIV